LFQKKRDGWSAFFITLGIWTKLFPALLVPWMVIQRAREHDWKSVGLMGAVILAVSLVLNLPIYLANPSGWSYFLRFQGLRPPDDGSIWAYLPARLAGSADLVGFGLVAAAVLAMSLVGTRKAQPVGEFGLGSLALLLLVARATSPQYNLWLMPFLALVQAPVWMVGIFVAVDASYFWSSFQTLFIQWGGRSGSAALVESTFGWIVLARWLALLMILAWVWIRLSRR
ncbi:MAG: glycosyltransferase 87 family protein, partial [Actinobacteria bacterium]|nr:glycosyltransferase 87 family protein [Actinomycetota bacterium]